MKQIMPGLAAVLIVLTFSQTANAESDYPIGTPGTKMLFFVQAQELPASIVRTVELVHGATDTHNGITGQWLQLNAVKGNKQSFSVYILATAYPGTSLNTAQEEVLRYIVYTPESGVIEFIDQDRATAILPNTGAWKYLFPRSPVADSTSRVLGEKVVYLGHEYVLSSMEEVTVPTIPAVDITIALTPDLLIGVPHNAKVKNETRRYDESDYEYVELTQDNYAEMIAHGMNVFRVNGEQVKWIENENVYYWGIGGADIAYPEDLYRSNYIGPALFFDEPMVHARDYNLKPKFKDDPSLRKKLTPAMYFETFKHEYHEAKYERGPVQLLKGLAQREDVDLGSMDFLQQNVYSWETMIASSLYQLSEGDPTTPAAIVFEPPGRLGAKRVLPELNNCFDSQIPADDLKNMIGMIKGFIRGAARVTGKEWGISIYGQVVRSEAYWYMTHAYEQGATRFFYWDSYQLAAVPYGEYLSLSKNLREHAKNFPRKNLDALKEAAEVAIVLPVGYNLGHVKMGIGNISGMPELNMERKNAHGIQYRDVMNNFYTEIERCIRLGVEYDAFWNLEGLQLNGYREIITIREDGKVDVLKDGKQRVLDGARIPERPEGVAPQLDVTIEQNSKNVPAAITAHATVTETDAPVYYTQGANKDGIYRNTYVLWELYGPEEEDYSDFWNDRWNVLVTDNDATATIEHQFHIDRPGAYRLRVSTSDMAGRSTVVWKDIVVGE